MGRQAEASFLSPPPPFHLHSNPIHSPDDCFYIFQSWPLLSSLPPSSWTRNIQSHPPSTGLVSDSSKRQFVISLGPETSVFNPESKMPFGVAFGAPHSLVSTHLPLGVLPSPVQGQRPSPHPLGAPAAFTTILSAWEDRGPWRQ